MTQDGASGGLLVAERSEEAEVLSEDAWAAAVSAYREAAERHGYDGAVLAIDFDHAPGAAVVAAVRSAVRAADLVGRAGPHRVGVLAMGLAVEEVPGLARRVVMALHACGVRPTLWVAPIRPAADAAREDLAAGDSHRNGAPRVFARCGNCGRRGAYVPARHPVVRCKFCTAKREIPREELEGAHERLATLAASLGQRSRAVGLLLDRFLP